MCMCASVCVQVCVCMYVCMYVCVSSHHRYSTGVTDVVTDVVTGDTYMGIRLDEFRVTCRDPLLFICTPQALYSIV